MIEFYILDLIKMKVIKTYLKHNNLKWALKKKKTISESFKIGDIILIKKENNSLEIKTISKS